MTLSSKILVGAAGLIAALIGTTYVFHPNGIPWMTVLFAVIISIAVWGARAMTDWQMAGYEILPETRADKIVKVVLLTLAGIAITSALSAVYMAENTIRIADVLKGVSL